MHIILQTLIAALTKRTNPLVEKAYSTLKQHLLKFFGSDAELPGALSHLEEHPDWEDYQAALEAILQQSDVLKDEAVLDAATELAKEVEKESDANERLKNALEATRAAIDSPLFDYLNPSLLPPGATLDDLRDLMEGGFPQGGPSTIDKDEREGRRKKTKMGSYSETGAEYEPEAEAEPAPPPAPSQEDTFVEESPPDEIYEETSAPPPAVDEDVQFTVFRPDVVKPNEWYKLLAYAHKEGLMDQVQDLAEEELGVQIANFADTTQDARASVPKDSLLRLVPQMDGVRFNPPEASILWLEDLHEQEFRLQATPELDGKTTRGMLTVFLDNVILAEVSLKIEVSSTKEPANATPQVKEQSTPYRNIFISYSHKDLDVVQEVEKYATSTGDKYVRDWTDLRPGEEWSQQLEVLIEKADIVQLFWSHNAKASKFVMQEVDFALSLKRPFFVRPVYWEDNPFPKPPENLGKLHMHRIAFKREPDPADANEP